MRLRGAVSQGLVRLGVHRLARRSVLGAVLMLHRVYPLGAEPWMADPGLWISDRQLANLIRVLRREGYELTTLDGALLRLAEPGRQPFICLTFDDGCRDFHDVALPVLEAEAAPATLYVTSGFIDRSAPLYEAGLEALVARGQPLEADWGDGGRRFAVATDADKRAVYGTLCQVLRQLEPSHRDAVLAAIGDRNRIDFLAITDETAASWAMMERLAESKWVDIGAHSRSHPALSLLGESAVVEEMAGSRQRLEGRLGLAVRHFAYPYGDAASVTAETVALAERQGFASAALAYGGPVRHGENVMALPRIGFGGSDGIAELLARVSGLGRAARPRHRAEMA